MPTVRRLLRQHALGGAWALALALLLSVGWGQVHRVLHPGALAFGTADVSHKVAAQAVPDLGDEDGSGLCQLLDHLTHGACLAAAVAVLMASALPFATPFAYLPSAHGSPGRCFDARGPPQPT